MPTDYFRQGAPLVALPGASTYGLDHFRQGTPVQALLDAAVEEEPGVFNDSPSGAAPVTGTLVESFEGGGVLVGAKLSGDAYPGGGTYGATLTTASWPGGGTWGNVLSTATE